MEDYNDYQHAFSDVKAIIFDLDGTLYSYKDGAYEHYNTTAAKILLEHSKAGSKVIESIEAGLILAKKSYKEPGYAITYIAQAMGMTDDELQIVWHKALNPSDICTLHENADQINDLISEISEKTTLGILSHSPADMIKRVLSFLDLRDVFHSVQGIDDVEFKRKDHEPEPFIRIQKELGLQPYVILFVEDSPQNLFFAKQIGMKTALIKYGLESKEGHKTIGYNSYIDARFEDLTHFLVKANEYIPATAAATIPATKSKSAFPIEPS